jgi:haloalkane dehalogenase
VAQIACEVLRTPDERFANLPGYDFKPHFAELDGLRMHYLNEGIKAVSESKPTFLCLHGQPTWSYLYRHMVPVFSKFGRVIVPDLFGFGRSDKPVDDKVYTFDFHRDSLIQLIEQLDLQHICLVCQDWGGLLGLTVPPEMPARFSRLLVMNTQFATGDRPLTRGFLAWREFNNANPDMDISRLMRRACPQLSDAEAIAYGAPFPDARYKAGVRRFPNMVPDNPDAEGAAISREARQWWKSSWSGETFMAIGMQDPVIIPQAMEILKNEIKNCPPPLELQEAGHFVQEWGDLVSNKALQAFGLLS